jgi:DNA sulfur modification protein DndB
MMRDKLPLVIQPDSYSYSFAALRGMQAGRMFYVAMCPLRLIPKLFLFDEEELPAEMRAQRPLNRARVPSIARYILDNPTEYVFSSITASIDGEVAFEPISPDSSLGRLIISMASKFIINDGQHRRAAIESAIAERPELGEESISVVLFQDGGLKRSQQMFADLNQYAIRPTNAIGILYDVRSPLAQLSRGLVESVEVFRNLTDTERSSISHRSIKLFTLSSIHQGTKALLSKSGVDAVSQQETATAVKFWNEVADHIPDWKLAAAKQAIPSELRREYIHSHGIALYSLGLMGSALLKQEPGAWTERLKGLESIDWSRRNTQLWEGRALVGGRISKATMNVRLTSSLLKTRLGLSLTKEENRLEEALRRSAR